MENKFIEYSNDLERAKELRDQLAEINEKIIHKRMELESLELDGKVLQNKYDVAKNQIKNFVDKYLTFSAKEVIEEFEKVSQKYGNNFPLIIEIGLSCQIVHDGELKNYNKKLSLLDSIVYLNDKNNTYTKNNSFLYFEIKSNDKDKVKFDFIDIKALDFDMKLNDGSKLFQNLYTQLETEKNTFNGKVEYFTNIKLKESAKENIPVSLDGVSYNYDNKIIKDVYKNLYNKSLEKEEEKINL